MTVGGGINNVTGPGGYGTSYASVVGGGHNNNAEGDYSVVPGGESNWSPGAYSFAAGRRAKATAAGQFVWADSQDVDFAGASWEPGLFGADSFCVRAQGGVLFTTASTYTGGDGQAVLWTPGNGSWNFLSDRNAKDRFSAVDPKSVLEKVTDLSITEWSYRGYAQRHIGPMAQDFHALFPLNDSDKTLNELDLHGVALAAIQGLNQKLEESCHQLEVEVHRKNERIAALERTAARVEDLEKRISQLEQAGGIRTQEPAQ